VQITPVHDPAALAVLYQRLLIPAFPPDELVGLADIVEGVAAGSTDVLAGWDGATPVAVAVGDRYPGSGVVLLSYLATDPDARSRGLGRALLDAALARWVERFDPPLVLAEVEDPGHHRVTPYGDPRARLRFYARASAVALDLPYLQPALRPGAERVRHLLLLALRVAPETRRGAHAVDAGPVLGYLREVFATSEGGVPDDDEVRRLVRAAERPDGVPVLPLDRAGSAQPPDELPDQPPRRTPNR
jgi:GNAT superfamily N-acetyltransferase